MRFSALALFFLLAACGSSGGKDDVSQVHFITFGPNVSGLVAKVKQPRMRACLSGVAASEQDLWAKNIQLAILKWVDPLRPLTSTPLTSQVDVVTSRNQCDTEVVVRSGTHSNTSIGQLPIVRMDPDGYFGSFKVLLHEFGHAFALGDTYQNGQSGNCQPGQPQAVMCNTSFAEPQTDDVTGLTKIFKRVFPKDEPPTTPPEDTNLKLNLALGLETSAGRFQLFVGADGADSKESTASAAYCVGTRDECTRSTATWHDMDSAGARAGVPVFSGTDGLDLVDGLKLTVRYKTESAETFRQLMVASEG